MFSTRLAPFDYLLGVSVALIWGMGLVFAKAATGHFPPILLMALRFSLTALVLVWFVPVPRGQMLRLAAIALIAAAIQYSLTFTGLVYLDASVAALVVQLEVPFLVLVGWIALGERPGLRKWIGIAIAFGGVAIIAGEPRLGGQWVAMLMVIGGAFTWAVGQAMTRGLVGLDGLTMTAWIAVMAAPQLFAMSLIFESGHADALRAAGPKVWIAVIYLGLVMTALGYGMWYTLLRRVAVSSAAPFLLLLPITTVLGSVLFLGERLTVETVTGGAVVLIGLGLILFARAEKAGPGT